MNITISRPKEIAVRPARMNARIYNACVCTYTHTRVCVCVCVCVCACAHVCVCMCEILYNSFFVYTIYSWWISIERITGNAAAAYHKDDATYPSPCLKYLG